MVYSAWESPGFGVCGHKNQYGKQVKMGNYVEDLEHFNDKRKSKQTVYMTEVGSMFKGIQNEDGLSEKQKEEARFQNMSLRCAPTRTGLPYNLLLESEQEHKSNKTKWQTSHEGAFGKRIKPIEKVKAQDYNDFKTISMVEFNNSNPEDYIKSESERVHFSSQQFSKPFFAGSHVRRK